jgi:flagellar biosynthesis protein FliQ
MNRLLAKVLLVLLIFGLLISLYFFSRGQIMEGLYIFPLLITIYVVMKLGGKGKE